MESSPSGPLIFTVDMGWTRALLPRVEGGVMVNVTPGGTESGAEPILDWHGGVVAKLLPAVGVHKAGKRKLGTNSCVLEATAIL